jgi:hypothetical protein
MSGCVKNAVQNRNDNALQALLEQLKNDLSEKDFEKEINSQDWVNFSNSIRS